MKQLSISKKLIFGTAIVFLLALFSNTRTGNAATTCVVNSAHFTTYGEQPSSFYEENEILENPSNPRPQVSVSINTTGCEGKTLNTSIINIAETPISYVQALTDKALVVPEGGILNITMRTGEDGCSAMAGSFDCKYFIKIVTSDGVKYRTKDSHILNGFSGVWTVLDDPKGVLTYEQHGVTAEDKWVFEQSNGGTPTPVDPTAGTTATTGGDENTYELISDLPLLTELGENLDSIPDGSGIGGILNAIFTIAIGIAGILAVVMIIYHAWEYLTTESITTKVLLKDKLLKIVLGILLLLGSTIILRTINPDLLNLEPNIDNITNFGGMTSDPVDQTVTSSNYTPPSGIICPKTGGVTKIPDIIASLDKSVSYRLGGKGGSAPYQWETSTACEGGQACKNFCPVDTICLDCSGFADYVYKCAGIASVGASSGEIFNNGVPTHGVKLVKSLTNTTVTIAGTNGDEVVTLKVGDLLGWPTVTTNGVTKYGHVTMYVGNGKIAETTSVPNGRLSGKGLQPSNPVTKYKNKIKYYRPLEN